MVTLHDVSMARARIAGLVRYTPLLRADPVRTPAAHGAELYLKLENLQISGSFKARGAMNKLRSLTAHQLEHGLVAASGGNHGLGVAYAGWYDKVPVTIYLAHNTPHIKAEKLREWGANVVFEGEVFDDANRAAMARAEQDHLTYVHPFNDPLVVAGQGTVALEIFEQVAALDTLIIAVGGGGLISGISTVARALHPHIRIIGVEPTGAPTYDAARRAGGVVELPAITTVVNTLAPRMGAPLNFAHIQRDVADLVLVTDDEMREAARWLWKEMNIAAELAGSAAMAALLTGRVAVQPGERVCVLVCGAGTDGIEG